MNDKSIFESYASTEEVIKLMHDTLNMDWAEYALIKSTLQVAAELNELNRLIKRIYLCEKGVGL